MEELSKHEGIGRAAMKAGMDRTTARKYIEAGKLPSELVAPRTWCTREDPFAEDWEEVVAMLSETPELEATTIFAMLTEKYPGRHEPGQLRTLQRHVRRWRAEQGPDKDVVLGQVHRAGEAAQTDFTSTTELGVTIAGELFVHLLCVVMLPFSNWQWATVCLSESMAALRRGVQSALFQLGRVPEFHQTDNSTAATHRIPGGKGAVGESEGRAFNEDYLALMRHFRMKPRTTEIGAKEQNGDVEASNGAIKRRLEQALLRRGSRDFSSVEEWESFLQEVLRKANGARGKRVEEDLAAMRPLDVSRLPEFTEEQIKVSEWSTLRVKHCAYSVPSRLIGETLRVRIYEDRIEAEYGGKLQLCCERLRGRNLRRIDYRHVIWSLVRKPGGFARYVYREEMFPSVVFRRAYDSIHTRYDGVKGDVEYLRILHLAASTLEADVEAALVQLLAQDKPIGVDAVKGLLSAPARAEVPALEVSPIDLCAYDALLADETRFAKVGT
ncbi:MAG: IS21 family transposase [Polyangiaceae bacterium]